MNIFLQTLLCLLSAFSGPQHERNIISVELRLNSKELKDSGKISFQSVQYFISPRTNSELKKPQNGYLQIEMSSEEPGYLNFNDLLRVKRTGYYLAEPGDEVVITSNGTGFQFSGRGAEKYRFQYQLDSLAESIPRATTKKGLAAYYLDSLGEYFAWTNRFNQMIDLAIPLINNYKGKMSDYAFGVITDGYISGVISSFKSKFHSLKEYGLSRKRLPVESLVQIYDTSYSRSIHKWHGYAINKQVVGLELKEHQFQRVYSFDETKIPAREMLMNLLEDVLKVYKGKERERQIINNLPKAMMKIGFTPGMEKILADYYSEPAYPEWKKWMKEQELIIRENSLRYKAPDFTLTDSKAKTVTGKDLKGKIVVLYFQDPAVPKFKVEGSVLWDAVEKYRDHPGVVFVDILTGKSNRGLQKAITDNRNENITNVIHASTSGLGITHPMLRDYAIRSFPWIWVIDITGAVVNVAPKIDFTQDNGRMLPAFIQQKLDYNKALHQKNISSKKDGPYVFLDDAMNTVYSIDDTNLIKKTIDKSGQSELPVQTDLDKTFNVRLQASVAIQPAVYPAAEKLLVFSDIEGNFDAFRKLLQNNKVIDENFNWIFGNGHLVFAGDMFDRGMQVSECLWLMYGLEEKAKAAGGYVHFVLGNHEIMNLQGYHKYTGKKYKQNAILMGMSLTELYTEKTEIGRWLRTKNIIEKIGDLLFVHGGISPEINRLPLSVEEINAVARPYYGRRQIDSTNKNLLAIYNSSRGETYRISPFWARGYYKGRTISNEQLDTTLKKFDVRRIITGHTIVADTISVHYGGRVINTDTKHAKGLSEALLIEGGKYYRVNDKGDKILLLSDDRI